MRAQVLEPVHPGGDECRSYSPSVTTTCNSAFSSATSCPGEKRTTSSAKRSRPVPRGSITISAAPRATASFRKVAATGWFSVGRAPITRITSACSTAMKGAVTAPLPMPSSSAATLAAWHSRVQ